MLVYTGVGVASCFEVWPRIQAAWRLRRWPGMYCLCQCGTFPRSSVNLLVSQNRPVCIISSIQQVRLRRRFAESVFPKSNPSAPLLSSATWAGSMNGLHACAKYSLSLFPLAMAYRHIAVDPAQAKWRHMNDA